MKSRRPLTYSLILALAAGATGLATAGEPPPAIAAPPAPMQVAWSPAVQAKPLSKQVENGLAFLVKHQLNDGGWGQGEESANMGSHMQNLAERSNVADTCITLLALIRAGSTPKQGPHAQAINRGLDYVFAQIEKSDADSLSITDVNGTRVQSKLGTYVDTFLASLTLAEAKNHMATPEREARLAKNLDKVLHKIQRNQRDDGGFASDGWAPVLAQAIGGKGLNKAAQKGSAVSAESRKKFETWAERQHDPRGGGFRDEGSAGVGLYAAAATVGTLDESKNTRALEKAEAQRKIADHRPLTVAEVDHAQASINEANAIETAANSAQTTVLKQLDDPSFVAGFGSNGGEEFLSYMLLAESLVAKGGKEWQEWDKSMTANLNRVQNADGSWTGHHCITGRNFVTAAALLVLTADRAQVPIAAKMRQG